MSGGILLRFLQSARCGWHAGWEVGVRGSGRHHKIARAPIPLHAALAQSSIPFQPESLLYPIVHDSTGQPAC